MSSRARFPTTPSNNLGDSVDLKSKSFRSRKLDFHRAIPVFRWHEVPDLDEHAAVSRTVPLVATGVDKEEEEEHHLQAAISASQVNAAPIYIPTPEATRHVSDYDQLYRGGYRQPKQLIKFNTQIEDCVAIPYDMDEQDEMFLKTFNASRQNQTESEEGADVRVSEDQFEMVMSQLERSALDKGDTAVTLEDLEALKSLSIVSLVVRFCGAPLFEYWRQRRLRIGRPLKPMTKPEEGPKSASDPYVCFRKRELKSLRKTRRSDAQSLEKLRKLRHDLETAKSLLEMVNRRDKIKRELIALEQLVFERQVRVNEMALKLDSIEYARLVELRQRLEQLISPSEKKRRDAASQLRHRSEKLFQQATLHHSHRSSHPQSSSSRKKESDDAVVPRSTSAELSMSQSVLQLMEQDLIRRRRLDEDWDDVTDAVQIKAPLPVSDLFWQRHVSVSEQSFIRQGRRRVGRGGRILYDRRSPMYDNEMQDEQGMRRPFSYTSCYDSVFTGGKSVPKQQQQPSDAAVSSEYIELLMNRLNETYYSGDSSEDECFYAKKRLHLLGPNDLIQLNNATVHNYNTHYYAVTADLLPAPVDFESMIDREATTAHVPGSSAATANGLNGASGASNPARPRKKRPPVIGPDGQPMTPKKKKPKLGPDGQPLPLSRPKKEVTLPGSNAPPPQTTAASAALPRSMTIGGQVGGLTTSMQQSNAIPRPSMAALAMPALPGSLPIRPPLSNPSPMTGVPFTTPNKGN